MHCDDKRTLYVLKEEIEQKWEELKNLGFRDETSLKNLNDAFLDYFEYKNQG